MFRIVLLVFFCVVLVWADYRIKTITAIVACAVQLAFALTLHGSAATASLVVAAGLAGIAVFCGLAWKRERAD